MIVFSREFDMPNAATFSIPTIRAFIDRWMMGRPISVDPFAGWSTIARHRNDINPDRGYLGTDSREWLGLVYDRIGNGADIILLDPPYSPRQLKEVYHGIGMSLGQLDTSAHWNKEIRDAALKLCHPGTIVLSFGWDTNGMGLSRGFQPREILIVYHGGWHHDTLCLAEECVRIQSALEPSA